MYIQLLCIFNIIFFQVFVDFNTIFFMIYFLIAYFGKHWLKKKCSLNQIHDVPNPLLCCNYNFFSLFTSSKKGPKMKIFSIEDLFIIVHQGNGLLCVSLRLSNFVILFLCLIELGHCELLTTGESCTALLQKTLHFILEIRAYGLE